MVGVFSVFANGGKRVPPVGILRIEDASGRIIEEYRPPAGEQVISPQHAYLITDILADEWARLPSFGEQSALYLGRAAAAKTGTTTDWRDNWTVGYTPDLVTAVAEPTIASAQELMKHPGVRLLAVYSASKFYDFQARRMNLRYKDGQTKKNLFCHTLNNTVIASPRVLIPLMELYQNADGSITVPEVLRPYMGGLTQIG